MEKIINDEDLFQKILKQLIFISFIDIYCS